MFSSLFATTSQLDLTDATIFDANHRVSHQKLFNISCNWDSIRRTVVVLFPFVCRSSFLRGGVRRERAADHGECDRASAPVPARVPNQCRAESTLGTCTHRCGSHAAPHLHYRMCYLNCRDWVSAERTTSAASRPDGERTLVLKALEGPLATRVRS